MWARVTRHQGKGGEEAGQASGPPCTRPLSAPSAYPVQHVCPALHGDTLEHGQDGKQDVVKIGDAKVGSWPVLPAFGVTVTQTSRGLLATRKVTHRLCICKRVKPET